MKKALRKLVLRKETLRAISDKQLAHVIGGQDTDGAVVAQSGAKQCPAPAAPGM
jgi:bacteriocin-like protein